MMAEFELE